eukprot:CAMPEP_0117445582 /NCGR_PEP_ID=MMETSP0759-20121206/5875_1 /TAXON_ID=63605 /ORGANISM="Percolomonas cosmopolitus, Strain WS" /LENGTH=120 /DNA_ID=CAMNT_0005237773 /DNA_START=68 /DNA_END=430 /DNA_ORIENTATION=+
MTLQNDIENSIRNGDFDDEIENALLDLQPSVTDTGMDHMEDSRDTVTIEGQQDGHSFSAEVEVFYSGVFRAQSGELDEIDEIHERVVESTSIDNDDHDNDQETGEGSENDGSGGVKITFL